MSWYKNNQTQETSIDFSEPLTQTINSHFMWLLEKYRAKGLNDIPQNLVLVRTTERKWLVIMPIGNQAKIFVAEEPEQQHAVERALQNLIVMSYKQNKLKK